MAFGAVPSWFQAGSWANHSAWYGVKEGVLETMRFYTNVKTYSLPLAALGSDLYYCRRLTLLVPAPKFGTDELA